MEGVLIDGRSQPGYFPGGTPIVELQGNAAILEGLRIVGAGNNSTVRGLVVNGFGYGFYVGGGSINASIDRNYIGTDASGSARMPNRNAGIYVSGATNTNIVGNLISGQGAMGGMSEVDGVYVQSPSTGTHILGNKIGTNAAGGAALGNEGFGILITGATTVGTEVTNNVISGNGMGGVRIQMGANGTILETNNIGTGSTTADAVPNTGSGVDIFDSPGNRIGGANPYTHQNTIANNTTYGILVYGAASTGNSFMGNEIRNNGNMGIELNAWDGVTANDVPDVNGILNFPVITSADAVGGTTHVQLDWYTTPNADVFVEIFANASCDFAGGNGEGAERFDAFSTSTDPAGRAGVLRTLATMPPHNVLTATVTMYNPGPTRTSEFSACYTIPAPSNPTANVAASPSAAPPGSNNFLIWRQPRQAPTPPARASPSRLIYPQSADPQTSPSTTSGCHTDATTLPATEPTLAAGQSVRVLHQAHTLFLSRSRIFKGARRRPRFRSLS